MIGSSPELRSVPLYQQQRDKTQLILEKMKTYLLQLEADQRDNHQPQANYANERNSHNRGRGYGGRGANGRNFNNPGRGHSNRGRVFNNSGGRHWIPKWLLQEGQNCFICEKNGHLKPDCPFLSDFIKSSLKRWYDCKVMHTTRNFCQLKYSSTPPEGHRYS